MPIVSRLFSMSLGLQQQSLREHLAKREEFLKAKARLSTLKRYIQPDADEQDLDMAMIAAVVKADSAELMHIVLALADEMVQQNLALEVNPDSFAELEKVPTGASFSHSITGGNWLSSIG